ncbi:MAG: AAA family ATPase [Gaiellaceae bacterium]
MTDQARDLLVPQDLEAEEAVLGAILLQGNLVGQLVESGLAPEHFYRETNASVFRAAAAVHGRGAGVDRLTISDELKRAGQFDAAAATGALEYLAAAVPNVGNVREYAATVRRLAFLRLRQRAAQEIATHPDEPGRWMHLLRAADTPTDSPHAHRLLDLRKAMALSETEPPWRCDRLTADGHVTTLVGKGGVGKSLLTLALAGAVQVGSSLAGIDCAKGRVVIFDAENGPWVIGSRLKAAETPIGALEVYDGQGLDLAHHRTWITSRCEGAQLVIFDSIRTLAPGAKENDSDDMAPVMGTIRQVARATGAAVIAIHHRGKGEADFRGSSALLDQTDLMFVLERDPRDPEQRWRRALRCVKCRIAEEPPPRWIGIKPYKGSLTLTEAAAFDPDQQRPVRDDLEDEIAQIVADRGPITRPQVCEVLKRTRNDGTVRRALTELVDDGVVLKVDGHRYITAPVSGGAVPPAASPETLPGVEAAP